MPNSFVREHRVYFIAGRSATSTMRVASSSPKIQSAERPGFSEAFRAPHAARSSVAPARAICQNAGISQAPNGLIHANSSPADLDSEVAIEEAIHYVEDNPLKEGKPPQKWSFVTPFAGIDRSGWTTYH